MSWQTHVQGSVVEEQAMVLAFDSSMWSRDRWISGEGTVEHPEVRQSFIPAINFFVFINCFLSVTLWENRKYIYWSLLPVPGTELLKPNDFLSDKNTRSTSYSNMCLWSHPQPRAPKTLINSQVIRTLRRSLFLKRWLWVGSRITPR